MNNNPEIKLYLPNNFNNYSVEIQNQIIEYINQLDDIEKKAYSIAKDHLGSSFHVLKSNGFNEWKNKK